MSHPAGLGSSLASMTSAIAKRSVACTLRCIRWPVPLLSACEQRAPGVKGGTAVKRHLSPCGAMPAGQAAASAQCWLSPCMQDAKDGSLKRHRPWPAPCWSTACVPSCTWALAPCSRAPVHWAMLCMSCCCAAIWRYSRALAALAAGLDMQQGSLPALTPQPVGRHRWWRAVAQARPMPVRQPAWHRPAARAQRLQQVLR